MDPTGELLGGPRAEVRGQSTWHAPASLLALVGGGVIDCAILAILYTVTIRLGWCQPSLDGADRWIFFALVAGVLVLPAIVLRASIGQWIWGLRWKNWLARSSGSIPFPFVVSRLVYTAVALASACVMSAVFLLKHPTIEKLSIAKISAFRPELPNSEDWLNLPFFYALGVWPKRFDGKPVLYTLPYEKGPPDRFLGRIIVRMKSPDIRLEIEGPKTPLKNTGLTWSAQSLRSCFTEGVFRCSHARDATLGRHLEEIRHRGFKISKVEWFEIENPGLTEDARPRGLWIQAVHRDQRQDRMILISATGTQQSLILFRPDNDLGQQALKRLQQMVGSLQLVEQLLPGRALINHVLETTRLKDVQSEPNSELVVERLSQIQAALLAKISVSPGDLEAYYHLGGTALLLAQQASQRATRSTTVAVNVPLLFLNEAVAAQKITIESARIYARDISPKSDINGRMEKLWVEIQKL